MDLKNAWDGALAEIELQISKPNFVTWFKNSRLIKKDQETGTATIGVANNFAKEWIHNKYNKTILELLQKADQTICRIEYVVLSDALNEKIQSVKIKKEPERVQQESMFETAIDPETNLHPRYGFKNFVVGSSNEVAYAASMAVVKDVGKKYNPLFVYGGTGLGKTHLIQAVGNEIIKTYKNRVKVKYVPSERFVNDVIWAIRSKRTEDIKNKYRTIDVLIIDDIQFIGGKTASEIEFFHTFNTLHQNNKQIIISSDRPPAAIPTLEDRLRSRFEGGMIVDVGFPDYEMKMAIIKNKAQEKNFEISDDVCHVMASKIQRNIREIEGIINKLYFYKEVKGGPVDVKTAEEVISATIQQTAANINPNHIVKSVASFFEVSGSDLINKSRRKEIVLPRQITMFLMRDMLGMSYPDIGERMGKRDHTTAIHSYEKISKEITKDRSLNQKMILIKELIGKNPST